MSLTYLGITIEPVGGGGLPTNIEVPPGSTSVFIPAPVNAFDFKYILDQRDFEVALTFVDTDPSEAVNFDALKDLLDNEVNVQVQDFNATAKDVTFFAEWTGIDLIPETLHTGASTVFNYRVSYRMFVDVV